MVRSQSSGAASGKANPQPSAAASAARSGLTSTSVTSVPGSRAQSQPVSAPTVPAPTTAIRSPAEAPESHRMLSAVSMFAASTARPAGSPRGSGTAIAAGAANRSWCGCSTKTSRPASSAGPSTTRPTAA